MVPRHLELTSSLPSVTQQPLRSAPSGRDSLPLHIGGCPILQRSTAPKRIHLAFAETYKMLELRIALLVDLPLESLDSVSLQKQLDAIGNASPSSQNTS